MKKEKDEFKMFNPDKYGVKGKALGPDYNFHHIAHDMENFRFGYVYNKKNTEDCAFYSPYLLRFLGERIGIEIPDTELGILLVPDIDIGTYKDSFFESSIVYEKGYGLYPGYDSNRTRAEEDVIYSIFVQDRPEEAYRLRKEAPGRSKKITVDEHIEAMTHFLTVRGEKPQNRYTDKEIEEIKQQLIDRIMFGLKFGVHGKSSVTMVNFENAVLDPYMLISRDMYRFSVRDSWFETQLAKDDKSFEETLEIEFPSQYGIPPNESDTSTLEVVSYLFNKYPKQTKKAYEKISNLPRNVLARELARYTCMPQAKKDFALRAFDTREKILAEAYKQYSKSQEINR